MILPNENFEITLKIQGLPATTNSSRRDAHWAIRHKRDRKWVDLIGYEIIRTARPRTPLSSAQLTLIRYSSVEPDYEGLVSSFKPLIDALTENGVIKNDSPSVVGIPNYIWRYAKPSKGSVEITIKAVAPEDVSTYRDERHPVNSPVEA